MLPKFLQPFEAEAQKILKKGQVGGIEFSGPTYQVQVKDLWAFIQLDSKGRIKDCFCSCEGGEACVHIAAAFLRLYQNHQESLHIRFQNSLWNKLCASCAQHLGDDPKSIKEIRSGFFTYGLFSAKGKKSSTIKQLQTILGERPLETEETSLKFSNLSQDEILLWKEGRPSLQLRYELSFWNDLAKWLMLKEDVGEEYTVSTDKKISISFSDVDLEFPLFEKFEFKEKLQEAPSQITYDKVKRELQINEKVFKGKELSDALHEYYSQIKGLTDIGIHIDPTPLHYKMKFDENWNLHIEAYLFKPADLKKGDSGLIGDWAYLDGDGFYLLEGIHFNESYVVIPSEKVSDFVRDNRTWLNSQNKFEIHVTGIETRLGYEVTKEGFLNFTRTAAFEEDTLETKDFGLWIYVRGKGFFSKLTSSMGLPIVPGTIIHPEQIPSFLKNNRDELNLINGFFTHKFPVVRAGLNVESQPDQSIKITPHYEIDPAFKDKQVRYYDEFVHIEGEGFQELTGDSRLPELFRHPIIIPKSDLTRFFEEDFDIVKHYAYFIDQKLIKPQNLELKAEKMEPSDLGYKLKMSYHSEKGEVKFSEIWLSIKAQEPFLFSGAGLIELHQDRFRWIKEIDKKQVDRRSHTVELSSMEVLRLLAFDNLNVSEGKELINELLEFRTPNEPNLLGMEGHLRPYQENGVHWLWFLYHHKLSGLLCDDMGLGKTHQAMALLVAIRNLKLNSGKFLIVCPTSVIYHWMDKLKKFLPQVRVCMFYGAERTLGEYDVLLTSYGVWRRECDFLKEITFEVAIFDEIQAAKNSGSLLYITLRKVKAQMRLGLTGTPIENRLRELKSLFDIVLPKFMPHESEYRSFFIRPIERDGDQKRKKLLTRFIKPFILRRKKEDVLLDLPEKTEENFYSDLTSGQASLYNEVLRKMREGLLRDLQDDQAPVPYIHVFAVLSALKQICNHPAAYLKTPEEYKKYSSGKWELFLELLNEARESGQKVVIFSQYLAMLDIMEMHLKENKIEYATIRGSTTDRGKQVTRFNTDPHCEVFLGSLHAAGWGIDLTAASVVIHYDRWWNAAREDQATDRVHRIGQTRGVQVFKLIAKGTFEERIDTLINQKGKLMEEVIGTDDHQFVKKFSRDEILNLLQEVDPILD